MTKDNEKVQMENPVEFYNLSQKDNTSVSLVMNAEKNLIAVKKVIKGKKSDLYYRIKEIDNIHLPKVYSIDKEEDCFIVIEEYIEGLTLKDMLMAQEQIKEDELIDIILQLCKPLDVLHKLPNPIIHRDIKPSNIIISKSGVLKLIDFDASREFKNDASKDTISLGTIEYAAPEQFGYSQTDVRTDIYAIGILISNFLQKAESEGFTYKHISELKKIVNKCTMFDPNQRYQNTHELQEAVYRIKNSREAKYKSFRTPILLCLTIIMILMINWTRKNSNLFNPKADSISNQNHLARVVSNDKVEAKVPNLDEDVENAFNISIVNSSDENNGSQKIDDHILDEDVDVDTNTDKVEDENLDEEGNENIDIGEDENADKNESENVDEDGNVYIDNEVEADINDDITNIMGISESDTEAINIIVPDRDSEKIINENLSHDENIPLNDNQKKNLEEPTTANPFIDYYKNNSYSDDIKIYIYYNKASKVEYLNLLNYGHVSPSNYSIDGNIITINKEFLNTLASDFYNLYIGFDKGQPVNVQFEVHAEGEKFTYGKYHLSYNTREFYSSSPENLTYLVYNIGKAKIKALWNGTSMIEASYYNIEDNGYVVTLDKSYLNKLADGTIMMLKIEFDNGDMQATRIKIMRKSITEPSFRSAENTFTKSSPEDVSFKIIWNDANDLLAIHSATEETPELLVGDYQIDGDIFTINKEFLLKESVGTYKWVFVFDRDLGNTLTINILDQPNIKS